MTRLILLAIVSFLIVRLLRSVFRAAIVGATGGPQPPPPRPVKLVRDPVCGTHLSPNGALTVASGGTTHYFCSEACREKFRAKR